MCVCVGGMKAGRKCAVVAHFGGSCDYGAVGSLNGLLLLSGVAMGPPCSRTTCGDVLQKLKKMGGCDIPTANLLPACLHVEIRL